MLFAFFFLYYTYIQDIIYEERLNQMEEITRQMFQNLEDGDVPIDNNASERAIRGFCIGKKNWEMIDTVNGAASSAIIYSIAETAKANGLKPFHYFEYLLTEIPKHADDKNTDFLTDLLPWSPALPEGCNHTLSMLNLFKINQ